jgi:hypothetical protein
MDCECSPREVYGEGAVFIRICPQCGRFVKADDTVRFHVDGPPVSDQPNATCAAHGRVQMPFEGWVG